MVGKRAAPVCCQTSLLLDLAPHGGYLSGRIAAPVGGLLNRHFTLTLPRESGILSVALLQALTRFRALPGMLPCGVRTFLGRFCARGHPANLDFYYTVNLLELCKLVNGAW
jgi:hypothetical protein